MGRCVIVTVLAIATGLVAAAPAAAGGSPAPAPAAAPQWKVQPTPLPGYGDGGSWQDGSFEAVSCATASYCMTVGTLPGGVAPFAASYF
jgi:hypothetical protein